MKPTRCGGRSARGRGLDRGAALLRQSAGRLYHHFEQSNMRVKRRSTPKGLIRLQRPSRKREFALSHAEVALPTRTIEAN